MPLSESSCQFYFVCRVFAFNVFCMVFRLWQWVRVKKQIYKNSLFNKNTCNWMLMSTEYYSPQSYKETSLCFIQYKVFLFLFGQFGLYVKMTLRLRLNYNKKKIFCLFHILIHIFALFSFEAAPCFWLVILKGKCEALRLPPYI